MPDDAPFFSIVIPAYNHARFLPEAVSSLTKQNFSALETIIVNDGSTDDSSLVARALSVEYPELSIRVLDQQNRGPAAARNAGISLAGGEWIVTLDSDDILAEGFLQAVAEAVADHPEVNAVTGAYREFGSVESDWKLTRFNPERLKQRGNILNCSPFRKSLWAAVGGFDPSHPWGAEDWHFWLKALGHGLNMLCLPVPMLYYRQHEAGGRDSARRRYLADSEAMSRCLLPELYPKSTVLEAHEQLLAMLPESAQAVRRTIAGHPERPLPHFLLGLAHEGANEKAQAKACYEKALACASETGWNGAWQIALRLSALE